MSATSQDRELSGAQPFRMRVADLTVDVSPLHEGVRRLCAEYMVDAGATADSGDSSDDADAAGSAGLVASAGPAGTAAPDLSIVVTQADIDVERALATDDRPWSDSYLETLAVLRAISAQLPQRRRLLVHGAVIQYAGRAYLFTAPSGTGKSTHIALWRQYLGEDVRAINGDKPFVRVPADPGELAVAYGTPWAGKEGWQENACAPLAGIVLLGRSDPGASSIREADAAECLDETLRQVYLPDDALAAANTLELLDGLLARTPLYRLACDVSEDAVRVCFEALTGLPYQPVV